MQQPYRIGGARNRDGSQTFCSISDGDLRIALIPYGHFNDVRSGLVDGRRQQYVCTVCSFNFKYKAGGGCNSAPYLSMTVDCWCLFPYNVH